MGRGFGLPHAGIDFGPVVAGVLRKDARTMVHSATFGIGRRIIEPRDPRMGYGTSAHGAGFERDP